MNNILMSFILTFLAGFGSVLGSFLSFIPFLKKHVYMAFILSFSASIMIFISIFDLLPNSIIIILNKFKLIGLIIIIIFFFLGVIVIKILNNLIEEGSSLKKIGILSFISIILHNLPEGIITFMSSIINFKIGLKMSFVILLHNIPEGLCISFPIASSTHSSFKGVGASFLAALAEPIGALITYLFLKNFINNIILSLILIFVSGIMIELSINNIYIESLKFKNKKSFILGVVIAFIFVLTITYI